MLPVRPARSARPAPSARAGACLALAVALLGGASAACVPAFPLASSAGAAAPSTERTTRNNVPIRIGKAVRGDLSGVLTFAGEVRSKGQVAVVPRVSSTLEKLYVEVGARVREGEPLAELGRAELEAQVLQAQAGQAAAEAKLNALKAGPRPEAVAQAQANLKAAQARLNALEGARSSTGDPTALQRRADEARARLAQAEAAAQAASPLTVAQADAAVNTARTKLNGLLADAARAKDTKAVDAAREELRQAEAAATAARAGAAAQATADQARREVRDADQQLALARLSFNALDVDQARALVEAADAQVKLVGAPASAEEVRAAEAAAEQAFALAELARLRLRDATVVAPVAGVVTQVNTPLGSPVGPSAPLLVLMPPELQVPVQADESQASQIEAGQGVTLSVESLPQESFAGTVKAIAPVLDPRTRTVAVNVEVPDPRGKLRPGMFAQLAIQTAQRQGVVLVPRDAVTRAPAGTDPGAPTQTVVFLVADNRVKRQRVLVGASDARNTEVLQGISEGVDVVLSPRPDLIDGEQVISTP